MSGTIPNFPGAGYIGAYDIRSKVHGDFWEAAYLTGNMFFATTALAGVTIPAYASNLVSTFTLSNPAASTKNLELMLWELGLLNATTVVSDVSLFFQAVATALATTTALTPQQCTLSSAVVPNGLAYSAATFTGALTKAQTLMSFGATTNTGGILEVPLNGRIIVPPGYAVTVAGKVAQSQAMQQTIYWNEF